MIHILYEPFPEEIRADGNTYRILTDFREWLRFSDLVRDKEIPVNVKMYMMLEWLEHPPDTPTMQIINELFAFLYAKVLEPDPREDDEEDEQDEQLPRPPVFDWKIDARYLLSDFRRYYNIDLLRVEYLHWWEFKSLFLGLPDESTCRKRIEIRGSDLSQIKNRADKMRIAKMQRQIALPYEISEDEGAAMLWSMWE